MLPVPGSTHKLSAVSFHAPFSSFVSFLPWSVKAKPAMKNRKTVDFPRKFI
jgi:hypothetical protein